MYKNPNIKNTAHSNTDRSPYMPPDMKVFGFWNFEIQQIRIITTAAIENGTGNNFEFDKDVVKA
jgi:hypothetical protein